MKVVIPRLLPLMIFIGFSVQSFSQATVTIEIDGNNLYYSESGCGDCNGSPDPRWRSRVNFNGVNYDWNRDQDDFGSCGWKGYNNLSWVNPVAGVPAGNSIVVNLNGFESDGFVCGGDDYDCGGYAQVNNVAITGASNPPCQWNFYTGSRNCGGGDYRVEWSNYWYYSGGFNGGSVAGDQTICTGGTPTSFTNSVSGTTGNFITYQWQSSPNNSTWTDIAGANSATYSPGALTATTYYRRLVRAVQTCYNYQVSSNVITVTVVPLPTITASGTATICTGGTANLTAVGSGGFGAGSYQWQSSSNGTSGWTNIGGATSAAYTTPSLNATTYYRCVYTTTASGCQNISNTITVTVNTASTAPVSITGTTAICNGSSTTLSVSGGSLGTGASWEWFSGACGGISAGTGTSITVSPGANTNYFVRASGFGPCPATSCASTTVTISTPTVAGTATPNINVLCQGGATTVTLAGQTGTIQNWEHQANGGGWVDIGNAGVVVLNTGALNSPGTNQFRAVVKSGVCPSIASGIATVQVDPTSQGGSILASQTSLCPGSTVTLTLSGHTGSIVQWERQVDGGGWTNLGNAGNNTLTTNPFTNPGLYEYRVLVQSGTCSPVYSTVTGVTVHPFDDASFNYLQSVFCEGASNPSPIITQGGGTFSVIPAIGLSINPTNGIIDLSSSLANTYSVTYTTSGACPTTASQSITVITSPNAGFGYSDLTYCLNAGANPVPVATTPGGVYTTLNPGLIFADASTGEIDLSLSQPGSYFVQYSLGGSCPSSSVQTVILNEVGVSAFTYAHSSYCLGTTNVVPTVSQFGGTFSATSPGLVFANNQTGEIDMMSSSPGVYTIIYNSGGICPTTTSQTVTLNAAGDPLFFYFASNFCKSATNPTPFVSQSGGSFTSSPAGLIFVSPATGEISLAASQPGNYIVTYNTGGTCPNSYSQDVVIIENENATFNYPQGAYCQYDPNPIATVAQIGGTFTSTPGLVFANQFTGLIDLAASTAGTYMVTYTVPGACMGVYSQQVIINTGANASLSYPLGSFCSNDTDPVATYSPAGGVFSSSPSGLSISPTGTIDLSASAVGAYTVYYTAPGLCGSTASQSINIVQAPQAFIQPLSALCTGSPATILSASPSGGTWSGGAYINASGVFDPAISGAGSFPVNYVVNGSGGCNASATYNVVVNASPAITINPIPQLCSNDTSYVLTATPPGGIWSGNPFVSVSGLFYPVFANAGLHTVVYTYNNGGCVGTATENIVVLDSPNPVINSTGIICSTGGPVALTSNIAGGTWSGGPYISPTGTFTPSLANVGSNSVTYTIINGTCIAQSTAQIAVNGGPNVNILTPAPFCENDAPDFILANMPGGVFTGGPYISGTGLFNPANATLGNNVVMYTVVGNNGCVGSDTVNVVLNSSPDATINYPGVVCEDAPAFNLTAITGGGVWSGGPYVNSGIFDPGVAGVGTHPVTYVVTTGTCSSSETISVTIAPNPVAIYNNQPNGLMVYFTDLSMAVDSWLWNFGDGSPEVTDQNPIHLFPDNGTYQVRLIAYNACGSDTLIRAVMVNKAVGIDESSLNNTIHIFPNPTDQFLQIAANLEPGYWQVSVVDISGKEVLSQKMYTASGEISETIDVQPLNPGIYLINLRNNENHYMLKFIKM